MNDLIIAIRELTAEIRLYNKRNDPQKRQRADAELFKADSEAESRRELHEELEALRSTGRGQKASRADAGEDG